MTDTELMQSIKTKWDVEIESAATRTISPAFLAALVANESGGDPDVKRFEPKVLLGLWEVLLGREEMYGSIGRNTLATYLGTTLLPAVGTIITIPASSLDELATSWGLTQIMGYHVLEDGIVPIPAVDPHSMASVNFSLVYTKGLLNQFIDHWKLVLPIHYAELFACWNCGRPDTTKTFDPNYCGNALTRMGIYEQLP